MQATRKKGISVRAKPTRLCAS